MILADTSIWIQHFRAGEPHLLSLLERDRVLIHPFVVGELALGSLSDKTSVIGDLLSLPMMKAAHEDEILLLIDQRRLLGTGLGYVDASLLAATLLMDGARLWTRDRRLLNAATSLGIAATMEGE